MTTNAPCIYLQRQPLDRCAVCIKGYEVDLIISCYKSGGKKCFQTEEIKNGNHYIKRQIRNP